MLGKFIDIDRATGSKINRPEGTVISAFNQIETNLFRSFNRSNPNQDIVDSVEHVYYKPDISLNKELIKTISSSLEDPIKEKGLTSDPDHGKLYRFIDKSIIDFQDNVEGFEELLKTDELNQTVQGYFGDGYKFDHVASGWYEPTDKGEQIIPSAWHLDEHLRTSKVRCFVFLSDESTRNAPLQVVNRKETKEILSEHSVPELNKNPELVEEKANINSFTGSRGEFILFNPATHLHRAAIPGQEEKPRRTLMIDFVPALDLFK